MGKLKAALTDATANDIPGQPAPAVTTLAEPALIVFGRDAQSKAHASRFTAEDADLAERAAGLMGMRVLRIIDENQRAVALQLAAGRIFESGRGFVPFCKEAAYEAVSTFSGAFDPPAPVAPKPEPPLAVTGVPTTWEAITAGSLVLASAEPGEGWWEAVVEEARGEGLFVLRWRDFSGEPAFVRRADGLGLLPAVPPCEFAQTA